MGNYIGKEPVNGFFTRQSLTTDGSTVTFTLNFTIASTTSILVLAGGVVQEPDVAYTLSGGGTAITFTTAPASNTDTYIHYLGQAILQTLTDLNGTELILDVDADTTIHADTDDEIDFKIGGSDVITFKTTGIHLPDGEKYVGGTGDDLQLYHDGSNSYLANSTGELRLATLTSGIAIAIGHSTSEVTFGDNVTVTGNLTIGGTTNFGDFNITNVGSIALDTITNDGTDITLDSSGDIILDAAGNDIFFKAGGTTIGEITNSSSDLVIKSSVSDKDILIKGNDGGSAVTAVTFDMSAAGAATFNDKIVATELDISGNVDVDGTLEADAITVDGVTLSETISDTVGAMVGSNTETGITVTYEDGDNTLDFALGAAQTTITSLLATDIKIGEDDQTKIDFETADTIHFYAGNQNQIKLVDGALAPITDSDVDLGTSSLEFKDGYFDGTVYADAINFNGTAISATAAEINLIDGGATVGTTAVADGDGIIHNDGGAMKVTTVQTFATYFASEITAMSNLVTTGALDSGSITSGFGNIDNGASNITSGGLVKLDVDVDADDVSADSATGRLTIGASEDLNLYHGGTHSYIVNDTGNLVIDTAGDLTFDAAGNDFKFLANGTEILNITNSSSDVIIKPLVDAKDIIFQQRDGTEVARIEDNATFNVSVAGKFAYAGTAVTSTAAELNLLDTAAANSVVNSKAVIYGSSGELAGTLSTAAQANVTSLGTLTTLTVDSIITNGTTIGHTDDTDLITLTDGVVTIAGNVVVSGTVRAEGGELSTTGKALVFGF